MAKKGNKKMILKILCVILGAIVILGIANAIANKVNINKMTEYIKTFDKISNEDVLPLSKDNDGLYTITTDRDLKIMQLTDLHIGGGWMSFEKDKMVVNTIATMIIEEKPDIVITTGDISFPIPYNVGTFNNQYAATMYATLMETLGVYWTPTFGNHDAEAYSTYSRKQMANFYADEKWENCLFQIGDESIYGYGNNVIKVKNSDGVITQALFTIDSNAYPKESLWGLLGGYDNIHENQIEWYKSMCEKLNAENNNSQTVKSLVFMHIPPVEYQNAWDEFKANGYKDTENTKYHYGTLGENVCFPKTDDQFFETAVEMKSTQGMFVGHDHVNIFSMDYKGIRLTYGMSIDYTAYKDIETKGTQRGCTIITVKPNGTFDCYPENYYQDKYVNPDKESVTMQQLNEEFN